MVGEEIIFYLLKRLESLEHWEQATNAHCYRTC